MKDNTAKGIGTLVSVLLIGGGAALVYPPAGLIVIGALVWYDLQFGNNNKPGGIL